MNYCFNLFLKKISINFLFAISFSILLSACGGANSTVDEKSQPPISIQPILPIVNKVTYVNPKVSIGAIQLAPFISLAKNANCANKKIECM